jgi:hypothetical protein
MFNGVLDAGKSHAVETFARSAHYKNFAKLLIKDQLGWHSRITARQHDRMGVLSFCRFDTPCLALAVFT